MATLPMSNETDYRMPESKDRMRIARYERNENSEVEFKFIIDLGDFAPEEIGINQTGYQVAISANQVSIPGSLSKSKVFHEVVSLPKNADMGKDLEAQFNPDGNLIIKIQIIPRFFTTSTYVTPKQKFDRSPMIEDEKTFYVDQVIIDQEFKDAEIKVNVDGNVINICAAIEMQNNNGEIIVKEYHEECRLPSHINPDDLRADYMNGILTLNAVSRSGNNSRYGSLRSNRTGMSTLSDVFQY